MKIKLLVPRAGPGLSQNRGDIINVSNADAKRMFESQPPQAEPVRGAKAERAVKPKGERAVKPKSKSSK